MLEESQLIVEDVRRGPLFQLWWEQGAGKHSGSFVVRAVVRVTLMLSRDESWNWWRWSWRRKRNWLHEHQPRMVEVRQNVLKQNDLLRARLRRRFEDAGVLVISHGVYSRRR